MAFDHENHVIDPASGFQRHKDTGHLIGIEGAPPAQHPDAGSEFPKWVMPHASHVVMHPIHGHVTTPHFAEHHVDRQSKDVTVLVHDAEDEARALAPMVAAII